MEGPETMSYILLMKTWYNVCPIIPKKLQLLNGVARWLPHAPARWTMGNIKMVATLSQRVTSRLDKINLEATDCCHL